MTALLLVLAVTQTHQQTQDLVAFAMRQWQSTPEMRIEDAYKWLFHATQGGEHAVRDETGPRRWMDREWPTLTPPKPKEPMTLRLTPNGELIRVNLRPYRAQGGDREMLLAVFVSSAKLFKADRPAFQRAWSELGARLKQRSWRNLSFMEWSRMDAQTRVAGYPAWGHSSEYERIYRPAYRVILGSLWIGR
jgi:hypothetical protein